jgi:hypothetical protein
LGRYSVLKWPWQPVIMTKQRNLWKAALEGNGTATVFGWVDESSNPGLEKFL